ncbi:MAG: hypothetical protein J7J33_02860 [Caldisericia bacterium]|nr:hypothetical protein [Caldisericia bacterium]
MSKLHISFLWHFHQPFYKDFSKGVYLLPWVRLHLIKNYHMMAKLVDRESVKVTFNFTPCLVEQMFDYIDKKADDPFINLSLKSPTSLNEEEKIFILKNFFNVNLDKVIKKNPRYSELFFKRGYSFDREKNYKVIKSFSDQDFLDLQVLFNLSWVSEIALREDEELRRLKDKGERFTEREKLTLLKKQESLMKESILMFKELYRNEKIEISTSPYSHPIMPLIINTDIAKRCQNTPLPSPPFSRPEDLNLQLKEGKKLIEETFEAKVSGLWPPEGAVSEEILPFIKKEGFKWFATDEIILYKSKKITKRRELYKPYKLGEVNVVFRDHVLSDLIGFTYSSMKTENAVKDFMSRVRYIRDNLDEDGTLFIILDGENAWEFYPSSGVDFLSSIYKELKGEERVELTTVSEAISRVKSEELETIATGSWIEGNFRVWIGEEEDNISWRYLKLVRDDFEGFTQDEKKKAKKAMFAAEGSDWNWWYGNEHQKATHFEFDNLYRRHLMSVYEINNKKPPDFLFDSIIRGEEMVIQIEPKWLVKPLIDGKDTDFFEWANGGLWRGEASDGTMIISEPIIELIKFGFDMENIYFLVKFSKTGLSFKNFSLKINLRGEHGIKEDVVFSKEDGDWRLDSKIPVVWKFDRVLEVKIPFLDLGFVRGEKVSFVVLFYVEGNVLARVPQRGRIMFTLPDDYYQCKNWEV